MTTKSKRNKFIEIKGASMHNLKNIDLSIPKKQLIVITGVSGSGKSSLAFDTIYAEGQRRYVESLSSYARQFLERIEKPKVEKITGLSPAIALEQKISSSNPRSTVGTKTEIYDYLKLLFSRYGQIYSPISGKVVKRNTVSEIIDILKKQKKGDKILVLSKLEDFGKDNFEKKIKSLISQNYNRVLSNNIIYKLNEIKLDNVKDFENFFLVIDRVICNDSLEYISRITDSVENAIFESKGKCILKNISTNKTFIFNTKLEMDGITFSNPDTNFYIFLIFFLSKEKQHHQIQKGMC